MEKAPVTMNNNTAVPDLEDGACDKAIITINGTSHHITRP